MSKNTRIATVAWLLAAVYYFYQYILRSAPSVMMTPLSESFGLSALGVASMVGLFYFAYSPFSLVAGAALDRLGTRNVIPFGAVAVGVGALLFSTGNQAAGSIGRLLQGAGGVFALVGAVYLATKYFPISKAATLIGATQMFGMAGGSAGQFAVGPLISSGVSWQTFFIGMGIAGILIGGILWLLLPKEEIAKQEGNGLKNVLNAFRIVFKNPQSILCGMIAGLLFIPTTIFDMVWGVRFLQDARGFDYGAAVLRSASVPFGWIIGCPLLGFISDRIGRRKPVIIGGATVLFACLAWVLFGPAKVLPPYMLGLLTGIASGAAMLPYTVIKEANPGQYSGTATGVINFLNFTFSALLGPVFARILMKVSGNTSVMELSHYQSAFLPLMFGVGIAIVFTFLLRETGTAVRKS
jgi:MFS family permease